MENRFEQTPSEENQGWGAYATPPPILGQKSDSARNQASKVPGLPHDHSMCGRFMEHLPLLLENADGEIAADTVRALYGHLSICEDCSKVFDEHQRVVAYLDAMPPVELPMDFTGIIQRRIQLQAIEPQSEAVVAAMPAAPRAFGNPAVNETAAINKRSLSSNATAVSTLKKTQSSVTKNVNRQLTQVENGLMQRLTAGSVMAAIMAYFVSSAWGREMLGQNLTAVRSWLDQMGKAFSSIPVFGRLALLVFTALTEMGDILGNTYRTVGDMAVRGLAMDIGVCIAAYYFLVVRKQNDRYGFRRA